MDQFDLVYHPIEKLLLDKKYKAPLNSDSYLEVRALLVDMDAIFVQNLKLADPKLVEDCDDLRTRCPKKSNECDAKLDKELNAFIARVQWECTALRKSLGYPTGILPWTERGDAFVWKMIFLWLAVFISILFVINVIMFLAPLIWDLIRPISPDSVQGAETVAMIAEQTTNPVEVKTPAQIPSSIEKDAEVQALEQSGRRILALLIWLVILLTFASAFKCIEDKRSDTGFLKKDRKKKRPLKVQIGKWVAFPFNLLIRFRLVIGVVILIIIGTWLKFSFVSGVVIASAFWIAFALRARILNVLKWIWKGILNVLKWIWKGILNVLKWIRKGLLNALKWIWLVIGIGIAIAVLIGIGIVIGLNLAR